MLAGTPLVVLFLAAPPTVAPAPVGPSQAEVDRVSAEAAAAAKAAQEAETRLLELRQEFEALETARKTMDDLRRRVEAVEAPAAAAKAAEGKAEKHGDDKIEMSSADGRFSFEPIARVQARFEGVVVGEAPGAKVSDDRATVQVRRAKLGAAGHVFDKRLRYRVQLEIAGGAASALPSKERLPYLEDGFVEWVNCACLTLRLGQAKVPFGFQRLISSGRYEMVDRSATMNAFDQDRDVGAWVLGRVAAGRVRYQAGVMNGAGRNRVDDNLDKAYVARLGFEPLGALAEEEGDRKHGARPLVGVGVTGLYNLVPTDAVARAGDNDPTRADADGDGRIDNVAMTMVAGELRALWRGFALQSEAFWRREDPGAAAPDRHFKGFYAQASGFVFPSRLQLVARVGLTHNPLYGATKKERDEKGTRTDEYGGGVSWYILGHQAKVQADYAFLRDHDALVGPALYDRDSHRVRLQVQVGL